MEAKAGSLLIDWENSKKIHGNRLTSGLLLGAGLIICLLALFGFSGKFCLTEGCQIYRGYKLWGISLHHVGVAVFALGFYWLFKRSSAYTPYIRLCLWVETALLSFQTFYLPCSECLIIGLIWGLLGMLTLPRHRVMKVWVVLFLAASALLVKDLIKPWPVYGSQDAAMKIFFSPSCKHCRETILNLMAGGHREDDVAFFPVALEGDDAGRVARFQQELSESLNLWRAFQACWSSPQPCPLSLLDLLKLHLGLLRNKLTLARLGAKEVPIVLSKSVVFGGAGGGCSFADPQADCAN
ncbi:MAG: hypothetical protein AB1424_01665 [Thermodesulfobacteriota bacterium]